MIVSSSKPNLSPAEARTVDWYENTCQLPAGMENTLPSGFNKPFLSWVSHKLAPKLGFGKVVVHEKIIEGRQYYRFTITSLFSKHQFVLTPLSAYMQAKAIGTLQTHGVFEDMVVEGEKTGKVFIPTWSRKAVYNYCRDIVNDHKEEIEQQLTFFHELLREDTPTITH